MNPLYILLRTTRSIPMLAFVLLISFRAHTQTTLAAGDIAFTGYTGNNLSVVPTNEFSFVLLKAVSNSTVIYFTDNGWNSVAAAFGTGEAVITWTATSALPQFTEVTIKVGVVTTAISYVSTGTATITGTMSLATGGDQVLAYQGTTSSPTFISGIQMNAEAAFGTSAASSLTGWDDLKASGGLAYSGNRSAIPPGLTNGTNAVMPVTGASAPYTEYRFGKYNCTGATNAASLSALAASINDRANWSVTTSGGPYTLPSSCSFSLASPPSITGQPSNSSICAGGNTTFSVTASNATGYQWQENQGSGYANLSNVAPYSGVSTATLTITSATAGMNGYTYRCVVSGSVAPNATSNGVTLTVSTPGTWLGTTSTAWSNVNNWSCATLPTASTNVVIPSGTPNGPSIDINTATCNNLTINSGAVLAFTGTTNVLDVKGAITNSGSFLVSNGKLILSGSAQSIPGLNYTSLEIGGSGTKTLSGAASVSGTFTLTNGYLQLDANDLTLGSGAILSGGSSSAHVITNSTGALKIQNIGTGGKTGNVLFPVGTSTASYTPLAINNTGTADVFGVSLINSVYDAYNISDVPTGTAQTVDNVNKTWLVTEGTPGGSTVTLTFTWSSTDEQPGFDRTACFAGHYISGGWHPGSAVIANGSDPYTISLSGVTSFSPFGVGSGGSVLPLELLNFTGRAVGEDNLLQWTTGGEVNVAAFIIERSADGTGYSPIGKVAGTNMASGQQTYAFTDSNAADYGLYRLKMMDKDGSSTYSPIVAIHNDHHVAGFVLSPNPVMGGLLTLKSRGAVQKDITVRIMDMAGREWYKGQISADALNSGGASINIAALVPGEYILRIFPKDGGKKQLVKFWKK